MHGPAYGPAYGPTSGPANDDDAGPHPWPAYFSPAANNNDAARQPSLPCRRRPAAPGNRTRPASPNPTNPSPAGQSTAHLAGQTQPAASIQSPNWLHPLSHDI